MISYRCGACSTGCNHECTFRSTGWTFWIIAFLGAIALLVVAFATPEHLDGKTLLENEKNLGLIGIAPIAGGVLGFGSDCLLRRKTVSNGTENETGFFRTCSFLAMACLLAGGILGLVFSGTCNCMTNPQYYMAPLFGAGLLFFLGTFWGSVIPKGDSPAGATPPSFSDMNTTEVLTAGSEDAQDVKNAGDVKTTEQDVDNAAEDVKDEAIIQDPAAGTDTQDPLASEARTSATSSGAQVPPPTEATVVQDPTPPAPAAGDLAPAEAPKALVPVPPSAPAASQVLRPSDAKPATGSDAQGPSLLDVDTSPSPKWYVGQRVTLKHGKPGEICRITKVCDTESYCTVIKPNKKLCLPLKEQLTAVTRRRLATMDRLQNQMQQA